MIAFLISILLASVIHTVTGDKITTDGSELTVTSIDQRRGFGSGDTYDPDIASPKSASFSPDGKKVYINSLEGGKTVVYDVETRKKLKVIEHNFESGTGPLWNQPSGYYNFTHYDGGESRAFRGKPVEEAFTPDGRYLFVPYYRRTFDLNAQDPSALAVIDTRNDEIVRMIETGPLPKMVRVSHDGKLLAITHWGDNTVGLLDISDPNPANWKHRAPIVIGNKLNLNYSLTSPVNRDSGSGFLLRGTVFLPGDSLLLVSGMSGPLNVIDVKQNKWIGVFPELPAIRHLTLHNGKLYMSRNSAGQVLTADVSEIVKAVSEQRNSSKSFKIMGVKTAKVGPGARTLKVSPSGKYIFVACNTASAIYIVRESDMKLIGSIKVDSFPVGLDISPDGRYLVSTSQGRKGQGGGNAVDFFEISYSQPEPNLVQLAVPNDTIPEKILKDSKEIPTKSEGLSALGWCGIGVACILVVIFGIFFFLQKKKRK